MFRSKQNPDQGGMTVEGHQWLRHLALCIGVFIFLFPLYWMVVTSFRPASEVFSARFYWLPQQFTGLEHYLTAFRQAPLGRYLLNGVIVCSGILLVQILTAVPCAWALARESFRGHHWVFTLVLLGLCIPVHVPALPLFLGLAYTGTLDSYFALMLPFFLSPFAIFLFRQHFKSFPLDIVHAARMDGISEMGILWRIVVPASIPAIAAFSVFSVVAHWNDLYWPMIVVTSPELATPPLGMATFSDTEIGSNFGALMAAAVILTAPLLLLFVFAQRRFIQGMTSSGVK